VHSLSCICCASTISLITGRKGSLHHRKKSLSSSSPKKKRISNNYSPNTIANLAFFGDSTADSSSAIADMNLDLHTDAASKDLPLPTPPLSCRSAASGGSSSNKRDSAKQQRKASTSATATTAAAATTKTGNRKSSNRLAYVASELAVEDLNVTSSSGKSTVQQRRCSTASSVASDVSAAGFQRVRTQSGAVLSTTLHSDQLAKQELTLKAQLRKVSTTAATATAVHTESGSSSSGDATTDNATTDTAAAISGVEQLISAWCAYEDEHGNVYYWNDSTGESRWDVTDKMLVTPVSAAAATTAIKDADAATATTTNTAPSTAAAVAAATPEVVATTATNSAATAGATNGTAAAIADNLKDNLTAAAAAEVTSPQQQQHAQHERKISIASQLLALAIEKRQLEAKLAAAAVVQCTVCMHAAVTRQVLPCEHKMCFQCSLKGIEQSGQCSVCQAAVTSVNKLETAAVVAN
jgi:Zinc finger, C3HC4 type (RING finger)